jgi:hypothetical protein
MKVTFTNALTGEYMWYTITLKAITSELAEVISIISTVRQKVIRPIPLKNPLDVPITMVISCAHSEISIVNTVVIPAKYVY